MGAFGTLEVSWQTKLIKLYGVSPVLSKSWGFFTLFVFFCHRIKHSKQWSFLSILRKLFSTFKD